MKMNKKIFFCMTLFFIISFSTLINFTHMFIGKCILISYFIMGVPYGIRILNKINPDIFEPECLIFTSVLSPILLILSSIIGSIMIPICTIKEIYQSYVNRKILLKNKL